VPNTARKTLQEEKIRTGRGLTTAPATLQTPQLESVLSAKQLDFWSTLSNQEQDRLAFETDRFVSAQQTYGLTGVEVGQRLLNVQKLLTPHGLFTKYLKAYFRRDPRTGYRYIDDYKRLLELLGPSVVEAMIKNGFSLDKANRVRPLGQYTSAYHKLLANQVLPPDAASEEEALRWVRRLEIEHERMIADPEALAVVKARNETISLPGPVPTYKDLLKQDYLSLQCSLTKIPNDRIEEFIESFVGYVLASRGVSGKRFTAQAIPDTFKRAFVLPPPKAH
jgi:hypothetical protein